MTTRILLTSFTTWLAHQESNSSDDLLRAIQGYDFPAYVSYLRRLPVDVERASAAVIATIKAIDPDIAIACGMAESRTLLSLERRARWDEHTLTTTVDVDGLLAYLSNAVVSEDAGQFVCEGLYYRLLSYLGERTPCLFVHVPVLAVENRPSIVSDFCALMRALCARYPSRQSF